MHTISVKAPVFCKVLLMVLLAQGCNETKQSPRNALQGGTSQTFADAQTAATNGLETFRKLVTRDNYKELGFETADEVANARLGTPLRVYIVKLDALRQYQIGSDPNALLDEAPQLYYPVAIGAQTRASVVVEQAEGKWKAVSFGNAGLAKQIAQLSKETSSQTPSSPETIVQIPALGLYFLGQRNPDNKLALTPLATNATYNLRAGATEPAEEVFAKLVPAAKSYNGLPM